MAAMNLCSPLLFLHPPSPIPPLHISRFNFPALHTTNKTNTVIHLLLSDESCSHSSSSRFCHNGARYSVGESGSTVAEEEDFVLDNELISRASSAKDAGEVLEIVEQDSKRNSGVLSGSDCCRIIDAAIKRNNPDLAMSIFDAMRSSSVPDFMDNGAPMGRWSWSRPDVSTFTSLILGLSASLRVSDAIKIITSMCRIGVSAGEEVPFGKVIKCPACMIAIVVAQPQHGIQIVSCSKCRYQYELVSGYISDISSKEISMDIPAWKKGLGYLRIVNQSLPAAVHSLVIQTPASVARTHRFATETVDLPAQEGERVTIALAAPSNLFRQLGPFKFSPKSPNYYPGEPICLTNHRDGRESLLLRAPSTTKSTSWLSPNVLFPFVAVLAAGDAASGIVDPRLPLLLSSATLASIAVGATINLMVLPKLSQLPQKSVDAIAIKQQLLAQYDTLQSRISDLTGAAEREVWLLARMCQLENKILAVGEPSYRARRTRLRRVREGLENSVKGRIELIDSYARISSMIEIEVELDNDVPAAEAASSVESLAKQIEQIMDLEHLEERWRLQAEANDEVERLLNADAISLE